MIHIGTVWVGDKFEDRYLRNLYAMLKRNISEPFELTCIMDSDKIGRIHPEIHQHLARRDIFGWWNFIEFYSGELPTPMVYLGLDTVIRGDITPVVKRKTLTMSRDFNYLIGDPNKRLAGTYADCACVIPEGGLPWLWSKFEHQNFTLKLGQNHNTLMHVWVTQQLKMYQVVPDLWQDIEPHLMTSYKWPTPKIKEPNERLVFWHGSPQIHECLEQAPWITKHWNSRDL